MFEKILIANRGEIALRIQRACRTLGIKSVAIYSEADRNAKYVKLADEAICIGQAQANRSYLHIPSIIAACEITNAQAVHPGFGFLAENADFARQVEASGFVFIGPSPESIDVMGDKLKAKAAMIASNVPVVEGSDCTIAADDDKAAIKLAKKIGYPLIIKAVAGGGGRGMRVVLAENKLLESLALTRNEALAGFANEAVYLERYLAQPRHIEVQILADHYNNVIYLGERDCSMQRRHQKIIEEAPALGISAAQRHAIGEICVNACKKMHYRGAGTFEFLYENNQFYFIEMNTRLQVEHTVTEMVTGIDIVQEQLYIASGEKLRYAQNDVVITGHALQCRINAEDPFTFVPSPGTISNCHFPGGNGVRIDSHIYSGYAVPPFYDSMLAKIIVYAKDRSQSINKMLGALHETSIEGIKTNIPLLVELLQTKFATSGQNIHFLERYLKERK